MFVHTSWHALRSLFSSSEDREGKERKQGRYHYVSLVFSLFFFITHIPLPSLSLPVYCSFLLGFFCFSALFKEDTHTTAVRHVVHSFLAFSVSVLKFAFSSSPPLPERLLDLSFSSLQRLSLSTPFLLLRPLFPPASRSVCLSCTLSLRFCLLFLSLALPSLALQEAQLPRRFTRQFVIFPSSRKTRDSKELPRRWHTTSLPSRKKLRRTNRDGTSVQGWTGRGLSSFWWMRDTSLPIILTPTSE